MVAEATNHLCDHWRDKETTTHVLHLARTRARTHADTYGERDTSKSKQAHMKVQLLLFHCEKIPAKDFGLQAIMEGTHRKREK